MGEIAQIIKQMATEAQEMSGPVQLFEGRITSTSPFSVRLKSNLKLELSGQGLRVANHLTSHRRMIQLPGEDFVEAVFQTNLNVGDRVMVAAIQGGQSFFILDKF